MNITQYQHFFNFYFQVTRYLYTYYFSNKTDKDIVKWFLKEKG